MNLKQITLTLAALGSGAILVGCKKNSDATEVPGEGSKGGEGSCGGKGQGSCGGKGQGSCGGKEHGAEGAKGEGSCGGAQPAAGEAAKGEGSCGAKTPEAAPPATNTPHVSADASPAVGVSGQSVAPVSTASTQGTVVAGGAGDQPALESGQAKSKKKNHKGQMKCSAGSCG